MIISSEGSATRPEVQETTDESIVPVPRVHPEFSGDTGVSAPVAATPEGICPGEEVPTSRAANIAIADSSVCTHMLQPMPTEMDPALRVRLECGVDAGTTETATVTLDETCVSVGRIISAVGRAKQIRSGSSYSLLHAKLRRDYRGVVMSFYGSGRPESMASMAVVRGYYADFPNGR
ncbi:hypothetical protein PI125_g22759 [Phytophthora idaei]|nr:hypothetical protein PI125_g22759 [Phytophthora idaei]